MDLICTQTGTQWGTKNIYQITCPLTNCWPSDLWEHATTYKNKLNINSLLTNIKRLGIFWLLFQETLDRVLMKMSISYTWIINNSSPTFKCNIHPAYTEKEKQTKSKKQKTKQKKTKKKTSKTNKTNKQTFPILKCHLYFITLKKIICIESTQESFSHPKQNWLSASLGISRQ